MEGHDGCSSQRVQRIQAIYVFVCVYGLCVYTNRKIVIQHMRLNIGPMDQPG